MKPLRMLGVDPGFANTGLAILEHDAKQGLRALQIVLAESKRATKKQLMSVRVSDDDATRLGLVHTWLHELHEEFGYQAIGVEAYVCRGSMGSAWKTAMTYGLVHGFALSHKIPVYCFLPADLKTTFGKGRSATKEQVAAGVCAQVQGARDLIDQFPVAKREHLSDAAGHACLTFTHMQRMRKLAGLD